MASKKQNDAFKALGIESESFLSVAKTSPKEAEILLIQKLSSYEGKIHSAFKFVREFCTENNIAVDWGLISDSNPVLEYLSSIESDGTRILYERYLYQFFGTTSGQSRSCLESRKARRARQRRSADSNAGSKTIAFLWKIRLA